MSDNELEKSEIPGAVRSKAPEALGDQPDTEVTLIGFETMINGKPYKLGIKRWVNERLQIDNYGLALHQDNPDLKENEQFYAVLKMLYAFLKESLESEHDE